MADEEPKELINRPAPEHEAEEAKVSMPEQPVPSLHEAKMKNAWPAMPAGSSMDHVHHPVVPPHSVGHLMLPGGLL